MLSRALKACLAHIAISHSALEFCLSTETYNRINEVLLTILFFPVLCAIALFERRFESKIYLRLEREMSLEGDDDEDDYEENPEVNDEGVDGQISKVDFEDLVKEFPDVSCRSLSIFLAGFKLMLICLWLAHHLDFCSDP